MTDALAWPGELGVPLNAEQDGEHWLSIDGKLIVRRWITANHAWNYGFDRNVDPWIASAATYVAPCLTPAEVARREREAELRVLEAAAMLAERIELAREGTRPPVSKALRAELARRRSETGK